MTLAKYSDKTDSGIAWLGDVPMHWNVARLRHVAELNPSKSEVSDLDRELPVSFLPMEAVGDDGTIKLEQARPIGSVENGYTYFREGDVTLAKITPCFENGKGAIMRGLLNGIGFGTTELIVVRPRPEYTTSDYIHWLFMSSYFRRIGESTMYGAGGQKRIPDDFVRNFSIAIPPLDEQKAISSFLDVETSKIDGLVSEQRRLIELLKEKRQAVISHAVTKGLNPNAPMKPSGIQWLGDVPQHWDVTSIRRISKSVETGGTPSSQSPGEDESAGFLWFTPGDFNDGSIRLGDSKRKVAKALVETGDVKTFPPSSVLIVSIGATLGKVGFCSELCSSNQQINAVIPNDRVEGNFLAYSLSVKSEVMRYLSNASTIGIMNQEKTKVISLAVPPLNEQVDIVKYLDAETTRVDTLVAEAERAIELLQERRTALISAAVTGKIDVREIAMQETA